MKNPLGKGWVINVWTIISSSIYKTFTTYSSLHRDYIPKAQCQRHMLISSQVLIKQYVKVDSH